jgi:hypothetical protein
MVGATKDPHRSRGGLRLVLVSRRSQVKLKAVHRIKTTDLRANPLERHHALGVTRKEQCIGPSGSDLVFSEQRIAVKGRRARWPSGSRKGVADAAVLGVASSVNCWWRPLARAAPGVANYWYWFETKRRPYSAYSLQRRTENTGISPKP